MSYTYKQQLEDKKNKLRDNLIQCEWNGYVDLAENLRKKIKQVDAEIEDYERSLERRTKL